MSFGKTSRYPGSPAGTVAPSSSTVERDALNAADVVPMLSASGEPARSIGSPVSWRSWTPTVTGALNRLGLS